MFVTESAEAQLCCPSAKADSDQSRVFGIVDDRGAFPIIRYLEQPVRVTEQVLALTEGEDPKAVFRFTSPCQGKRCTQFSNGECSLPRMLESRSPASGVNVANCAIRSTCRWFYQRSFHACVRCSAIVTSEYAWNGEQLLDTHGTFTSPETPSPIYTKE